MTVNVPADPADLAYEVTRAAWSHLATVERIPVERDRVDPDRVELLPVIYVRPLRHLPLVATDRRSVFVGLRVYTFATEGHLCLDPLDLSPAGDGRVDAGYLPIGLEHIPFDLRWKSGEGKRPRCSVAGSGIYLSAHRWTARVYLPN
ncbi:hypothetical protein AB0K04_21685 [Micromonospora coxensis]|uniref:hypothetical protein n=1 Tax=Micromonospora coxensis TaxID=356852 RepID=UPI00343FE307